MHRVGTLAPVLALIVAACGGGSGAGGDGANGMADNAAVADEAPTPPAGAPTPLTPSTTFPPGEGIPGATAPAPTEQPGPAPAPDAPLVTDPGEDATPDDVDTQGADAAAALTVARQYLAAVEHGQYRQADRLVEPGGPASQGDTGRLRSTLDRYSRYRATLGVPGRIDAGAGQRYVTVPVRIVGTMRDDARRHVLEGPVILHRTADIDGATAAQRSWRIRDIALEPRTT